MEQKNTKVYKFDLSQFKKNTLKSLIAYCIFIVIFSTIILLYITDFNSPFQIVSSLALYIMLLYFAVIKVLIAYFRADKTHKDDSITIYKENDQIISIDVRIRETKYDEFYSIKKITQLHRRNYIDVKGVIYCVYNESSSDDTTDLRIPLYF